jgi:hypothetical protein
MSRLSDRNLRGVPMKPYDMVREGLMVLAGTTLVILLLAGFWGFPDYRPLTPREVATKEPVAFLQRTLSYFSGKSGLQTYGPPYTHDYGDAQHVGFICPACWVGVVSPLDAKRDLVMEPLEQIGMLNPSVAEALKDFQQAPAAQQTAWIEGYSSALKTARVDQRQVVLPPGRYGPVTPLMEAMLNLARAGLLDGALTQNADPELAPYNTSYERGLLYLGGPIIDKVAGHLDEQGGQWGMVHTAGLYPGAWWLWPYAFLYQIPAIGNSPNADLIAGMIILAFTLLLVFLPVIPGLNRIPYIVPVYKIIWRDWYRQEFPPDPVLPPKTEQDPRLTKQTHDAGCCETARAGPSLGGLFLTAGGLGACARARSPAKIHERPLLRVAVDEDHESREEKEVVSHSKLRLCAQPQARKATVKRALSAPYHARIVIIARPFRASPIWARMPRRVDCSMNRFAKIERPFRAPRWEGKARPPDRSPAEGQGEGLNKPPSETRPAFSSRPGRATPCLLATPRRLDDCERADQS